MKHSHFRPFAVLLLCALLLSGCAGKEEAPPEEEKVTLSALQYELENMAVDFNHLWFYQKLEEETGVRVEFEDIRDSEWNSSVSLAFTRGRMPDLILRGSLDVEEYGVSRHLLVPLDEYMDRGLLPVYTKRMEEAGLRDQMTASDGHIYELGFLISQGINTDGHFFINRAWLDTLGLEVPGTLEELTETLRAFRNRDPNGNGERDEVPLECTLDDNNTGIYNLFSFFGLPMNAEYVRVTPEGRVSVCPGEESFREGLEWLHELYREELLGVDFISQGSNIWAARVNEGNTGMFSYWRLQNTALDPKVAERYEIMLPVSGEGRRPVMSRNMDIIEFGAALTTDNPHIEESLRWLDAQFETENMLVSQNGTMGDMLEKRADGRYEVKYVPAGNELYQTVPVICGQFFAPAEYYESVYVPAPHRQEKSEYCKMYEEAGVLEEISYKMLTRVAPRLPREDAELTRLQAKLKTVVDAGLVQMVTQGVTDERWSRFLSDLEEAGSEEYRDIYQTVYDRWKKNN